MLILKYFIHLHHYIDESNPNPETLLIFPSVIFAHLTMAYNLVFMFEALFFLALFHILTSSMIVVELLRRLSLFFSNASINIVFHKYVRWRDREGNKEVRML